MKKIVIVLLIVAVVAASFGLSVFFEYIRTGSGEETVIVEIPRGASEKTIAHILKDNGVIRHELSFRLKMRTSPYRGQLNYGKYTLNKKMCLEDIIAALLKPSDIAKGVKLTIPEGFSAKMIAERCEKLGLVNAEDFLSELKKGKFNYDFIKDIPKNKDVEYKLEGYLFPSTHMFGENADAHKIIDTLLAEFEKQYNKVRDLLPDGMDMNEAIIRASLIEREAKLPAERSTISGVIQNRLDIDMRLQIDASVVYAISDGMYDVERVLYKDLEVDSPYNTYKHSGLPAGAICNPGMESIRAAMEPEEHKYLYYHTDTQKNDGSHIFSETFSQHKK
ncbi:MAG: endolytic transglycosylase MltG [Ruminococcaceae bacterium]|nr:endolytic transglycosylase MltG [Oscillospiraceae bacterium]